MSVSRYTWDTVTPDDVSQYVKKNNLKLVRDKDDKYVYIGVTKTKPVKFVFRYDVDDMKLYSDYTIIQLEDGRLNENYLVDATLRQLDSQQ